MKFEKLQSGMTAYSVGRHKLGNTNMSTVAVWPVRVLEVDADTRSVTASWDGNKSRTFYERDVKGWREKKPLLISTYFGGVRLATREEQKAARGVVGAV